MFKRSCARFLLAFLFILILPVLAAQTADGPELLNAADSMAGPWRVVEDEWFRYVYKDADEPFLAECMSVARESFEIVTGFFKALPSRKPTIILYGSQDSPSLGGFAGPMPMRIGLVAPGSQISSAKTLVVHEYTHYLQSERGDSGGYGALVRLFNPSLGNFMGCTLSEISIEGTTSFLDGSRRREFSMLPVRAAVLEGRMWTRSQASSGGLTHPGALRVYLSGLLFQDWVYDRLGPSGYFDILERKNRYFLSYEDLVVKEYTGLDLVNIWGEICNSLEERYAPARTQPRGQVYTPRDSINQHRWSSLYPSSRGFLHLRQSLSAVSELGFWRPGEDAKSPRSKTAGTKESPFGILVPNPGRFIQVEGLAAGDVGIDAQAERLVAVINQSSPSSLHHAPNRNHLVLGRLEWSDEGQRVAFRLERRLPGSAWSSPVLSPDGSRLWALQRSSDRLRAGELDMETGSFRPLNISEFFNVVSLYPSPDGRALAVELSRSGRRDVGIYDLVEDTFTLVTDDEADDRYPRFLEDGRFVFSSDREGSVFVYAFDGGSFSRILTDRIGAWAPVLDGAGGYWYSSVSTEGAVICRSSPNIAEEVLEDFLTLLPSWLERRDELWALYSKEGRAWLSGKEGLTAKGELSTVGKLSPRPLFDLARPTMWLPSANYAYEGARFGLGLFANSYLNTNQWDLSLSYIPGSNQLAGSASISLNLPRIRLSLDYEQDYIGTISSTSQESWYFLQAARAGFTLPVVYHRSLAGSRVFFNLAGNAVWAGQTLSSQPFNLAEGFSLPTSSQVFVSALLSGGVSGRLAPAALYGPSHLHASLMGLFDFTDSWVQPRPGFSARLSGASTLAESLLVGASADLAWRQDGGAWALLPRTSPRWDISSLSPLRLETEISLAASLLNLEYAFPFFSNEVSGNALRAKTFFETDSQGRLEWLQEYEIDFSYKSRLTFLYSSFDLEAGLLLRLKPNEPIGPEDLAFKILFNGQLFVTRK